MDGRCRISPTSVGGSCLLGCLAIFTAGLGCADPAVDPADGSTFDAGSLDASRADSPAVDGEEPTDHAGGSDAGLEHRDWETAEVAEWGTVTGEIVDGVTGMPIEGAQVALDGAEPRLTPGNGLFLHPARLGRHVLSIVAAGYVPHRESVGVTTHATSRRYRLLAAAAPTTVGAAGGAVSAGDSVLRFPVGAYASETPIVATSISGPAIARAPGPVQFVDESGRRRRVVSVLSVQAAEPSVPVELEVPVPPSGPSVALFSLGDDGYWGEPRMPVRVEGGRATFSLEHFSEYGVAQETPVPELFVVESQNASVTYETGEGAVTEALQEGAPLPRAAVIATAPSGSAVIEDPAGAQLTLSEEGTLSTEPPTETSTAVHLERARLEVIERLEGAAAESRVFRIRTRAAVHGVRGTIVAFRSSDCPGVERSIDSIEVTEGSVETILGATPPVIEAGQRVESCLGCPDDAPPRCCDSSTCAAGCCSREDRCETGDTAELCGPTGGACDTCWHPSLPYCDYSLRSCRGQHCYTTAVDAPGCHVEVRCNDGTTYSTTCTIEDPDGRFTRCTCTSSRGANETRSDDSGVCPFTGFRVREEVPYVPFCYHFDS